MASSSSPSSSSSSSLLYACIAHDTTVLCEHFVPGSAEQTTPSSSSRPKAAATAAAKAPAGLTELVATVLSRTKDSPDKPPRRSWEHSSAAVHTLVTPATELGQTSAGKVVFLVIAPQDGGQALPHGFLASLEKAFFAQFDKASTDFAALLPYGCAAFHPQLAKLLLAPGGGTPHAQQQDALTTARNEINVTKHVMTHNIQLALDRGEHMDTLVTKTSALGDNAREFRVKSRTLRRTMWWNNVRLMALLLLVFCLLFYLLLGIMCGLPGKSSSSRISSNQACIY
ncbi:hypothetical protein ACEQ8H_004245 [Pleosporales sp. CAS-2024a]